MQPWHRLFSHRFVGLVIFVDVQMGIWLFWNFLILFVQLNYVQKHFFRDCVWFKKQIQLTKLDTPRCKVLQSPPPNSGGVMTHSDTIM